MQCHMRVARPVADLDVSQSMYCTGLNLQVVGQFRNHEGFDGVMIGSPSMSYHFEFTRCQHHQIVPSQTPEDFLIFYEPDKSKWSERCDQLILAGFIPVNSFNPYWDVNGKTFQDVDGYRLVMQNSEWNNVPNDTGAGMKKVVDTEGVGVKSVCQRLYLNDSHHFECSAQLIDISRLAEDAKYGHYRILLNQSVFHPQGGGQPSDIGVITFPEGLDFDVAFVQVNADGDVEHLGDFVEKKDYAECQFPVGTVLHLAVNKEKRIEHIRLHSAGHVMDAALKRLGFWDRIKSGKGYHFPDNPYVEYVGQLSPEEMDTLPAILNAEIKKIVAEDIATNLFMEDKVVAGELCSIDTTNYPDTVRVADIAGCPCPCGGTHIKSTKELGGIEVTKCKKKKKNIRISYVLVG